MKNIYLSVLKDDKTHKNFFILDIEKEVLKYINSSYKDKFLVIFGNNPKRCRLVKAANGFTLKKSKKRNSYEFNFYHTCLMNKEFIEEPVTYFVKNNHIQIFIK